MYDIGPYRINSQVILAPMAGVTDQPFRQLCRRLGAGMTVSEMVTADTRLWNSPKSRYRLKHDGEPSPRIVQIAGGDADMLATAAAMNVAQGAQIIDINMGCPAKKVCNKAAGSALMKDEALVADILHRVVNAVDVPVTLKIRTGWDQANKNALTIAKMAEQAGIQALAVHGRTRACGYKGAAEYDVIAEIKSALSIPVFANGDINSPEKARQVLAYTGADAVMIGRAAQGRPWIFREIQHYLNTGQTLAAPSQSEIAQCLLEHLQALHQFYGEHQGVRIARKHVGWYLATNARGSTAAATDTDAELNAELRHRQFRSHFNTIESMDEQLAAIQRFFNGQQHNNKAA